jgi:hypothetical protein
MENLASRLKLPSWLTLLISRPSTLSSVEELVLNNISSVDQMSTETVWYPSRSMVMLHSLVKESFKRPSRCSL